MNPDSSPDQREILRRTSRSFALSMAALPRSMREPVEVAYLLARAADTIADTDLAPPSRRLKVLEVLRSAIAASDSGPVDLEILEAGPGPVAADPVTRAEQALLGRIDVLLTRLGKLDPVDQDEVRQVLSRLLRTMEGELAWFFSGEEGPVAWPDVAALRAYTDGIAGCVGPFWVRLVHRHVHPFPARCLPMLEAEARRYGRALQLVNILRDLPRDLQRGVCLLPLNELSALGLHPGDLHRETLLPVLRPLLERYEQRSRRGLFAGLALAARIPVRAWPVRAATALPAVLGLRTLKCLEGHARRLDPEARIRISRGTLRWAIARTAFLSVLPKGPRLLV